MADIQKLTPKSQDIAKWYNEVVLRAQLADYGPSRGTMVIRPDAYFIWEQIQAFFDRIIKEEPMGVRNAYFPVFIPARFIEKEKDHIEGFAPQLAVVTLGGGKELEEKLIIRPTSETIINHFFSKWISSWRDLPMKLNQWCNIVRWEMRTMLFMRTTEFLWQEGHTAHADEEDARKMAQWAFEGYQRVYQDLLALPFIAGRKSESEKFAGGNITYAVEVLMPDGRALQAATSHELGQNFGKVFETTFQNKEGKTEYVWQTSWGLSTRSIGGMIMAHGDDKGLVVPPKVAPSRVVVIPILGKADDKVLEFARRVIKVVEAKKSIYPGRVELWDSETQTFGWKANEAELKGIPVMIAVGPKEAESEKVELKRRDTGEKSGMITMDSLADKIEKLLGDIQAGLLSKQDKFLEENTHEVTDYDEFKKVMAGKRGFIRVPWCERAICEEAIKAATKATSRALTREDEKRPVNGKCFACDQSAKHWWIFGQSY